MAIFTETAKVWRRVFVAQYVILGVAVLALAGLIIAGLAVGKHSLAATARSCGDVVDGVHNSIANNPDSGGGCGSLTPEELITDINNGNPDDQAGIYAHFGLSSGDYTRFKNTARMGVAKMNGDIIVDDEKVMTDAWSIGRVKFSYSSEYPISGVGTYFKSAHTDVLKSEIPVMVMFDGEGSVEAAVLTSCGNPVNGQKVKSSAVCKKLIKTPVEGKKNTFSFTTDVGLTGLAKVVKVDYFVDEGSGPVLFKSEPNPDTPVTKEFTKDATVIAKVTVSLPGKQNKVVESQECRQQVAVKKEVPPPPEQPKEQPKVMPATTVKPPAPAPAQPLPATGPGGLAGLFVGTGLAGAVGHRIYTVYRGKRPAKR